MRTYTTLLTILVVTLFLTESGYSLTSSWTNATGGTWSVAGNWDNGVPGINDTAQISLAGTYTVTVDAITNLETLLLGGVSGTQTLLLSQTLNIAAAGLCCEVGVHGYLDIVDRLDITGSVGVLALSNSGTMLCRGEFYPNIGIVRNESGGSIMLSCNYTDSFGQSFVENYGTMVSDGCGSSFRVYLINYESGSVTLSGDDVFADIYNRGNMELESGAVLLQLGAPAFYLNAGTCVVRGNVEWKGYSPELDPNFTNSGLLEIAADTSLANDDVLFEVHYYSGFDTFQTSNVRLTSGNAIFTDIGDTLIFDDSLSIAAGCTLNVSTARFTDSLVVDGTGTIHFLNGFSTAEGQWPFSG